MPSSATLKVCFVPLFDNVPILLNSNKIKVIYKHYKIITQFFGQINVIYVNATYPLHMKRPTESFIHNYT